MILKQVIHYPDTNSVEATWVNQTTVFAIGTEGEEGYVPESVTEQVVKCHSYADVQMDMLRTDLGDDVAQYAELIALVEANIKPAEPESVYVPQIVTKAQGIAAMIEVGLWSSVKAFFATEASEAEQDLFSAITEFHRQSPLLVSLKARFDLTDDALDNLFILASGKVI